MVMNKGIPLREALDWNPCGCVETNLEGRLRHYTALADINLGGMIEFAMTNGVNPVSYTHLMCIRDRRCLVPMGVMLVYGMIFIYFSKPLAALF